ncbi:MAG: murein L,D-transpeptidase [Clostridia bacterium]|nr:murein L,D-transpeptidase [Clostridia bacterium]
MKKIRILLALTIIAVLLSSVLFISEAEPVADEVWQADLLKLMDPADVPSTTQIDYQNTYEEGAEVDTHDIACEITVDGVTYGCEFVFELSGETVSDWAPVQDWLGYIVTSAASTAGSDSESLAKAIDKAIIAERKAAQPDAEGKLPAYASPNLKVKTIRVSTPFYPELSVDKNGEATKRLQQRLVELGFLTGGADGFFGEQTKAAVAGLEEYIRELEQDLIDVREATTPEPTEVPTQAPTVDPTVEAMVNQLPENTHELTLIPRHTPTPTPEPTPTPTPEPTPEPMDVVVDTVKLEPVTQVDGVADALLQAYVYSDAYRVARRELVREDNGADVTRLQNRLLALGYMVGSADGHYGGDTARAVRIFQYYNALPQTGLADMDTLKLVFSANAKAPANPMLAAGSQGDAVRTLQTRLRELGFGNIGADGDYGDGTVAAVKNLQEYMRGMEEAFLRSQDPSIPADADLSSRITVEVNGVADPLILDVFYSGNFPAIPMQMQSGTYGDDVVRLQRRLSGLEFLSGTLDGQYGGQTQTAVTAFQKRNSLPQTGVADAQTLSVLFSGQAKKALKPYILKVSTNDQRVYAYGLDDNNEYTVLVRTMKCSTGKNATPTPKGTYQATTGPGARWHYFKKFTCWAQYAYYIEGDIMFHSVLYNQKGGPVTQSSVNNLGRKASHGCVRLAVEDAKWIWQNCPKGTQITVY